MILVHRLTSFLRWLFRRKQVEQELQDELQVFLELSAAEKMKDGTSAEEANRAAKIDLGGAEQIKERVRTYRWGAWLDEFAQDVRYALRMYLNNPGLTITIVLTLALGIGANTAIFSLTDALILRWLPVEKPQELVQLKLQSPGGEPRDTFSYPIVRAIADQSEIFTGVAGFSGTMNFTVGSPGNINKVAGTMVSGGYYETLGVKPAIGRLLTREDDQSDSSPVAVISHGYWERQYARQGAAVGQSVRVNGIPVTIVGVSAAGFTGANVGQVADITFPIAALARINPKLPLLGPGNFWLRMLARPKPGISVESAKAQLARVWPGIAEQVVSPGWPPDRRKAIISAPFVFTSGGTGWTYLRNTYGTPLRVLMAVVALVLLIACANVAGLQLARGLARQREMAVRLAIGAGRGRIMRQFLVESTLLSLIACVFGVGLAWLSSTVLVNTISTGAFPVILDLTPNTHVLGFTALIAITTGVLSGLAPALHISLAEPSSVLREDARVAGMRSRLIPCLVTAQVCVSLVLLIGANLFIGTLRNLQSLDTGFSSDGVLLVSFDDGAKFRNQLLNDISGLPGVVSASVSTDTPLSGGLWTEPAVPAGQPLPQRDTAIFVGAGPMYFETIGTALVSGHGFSETDSSRSRVVAVVNEAFVARYFPGANPIGQYISSTARVGEVAAGQPRNLEIVGVAKNTSAAGLRREAYPTVYVPYAQLTGTYPLTLEVRASGSLVAASSAIRTFLQSKLPDTLIEVRPLSAQVEAAIVQERMMATLAGGFAVLALMVTCVGLYGVLAYNVARRTKEIGIRIGLGASSKRVIADVLRSAVRLVLVGIALGLPLAAAAFYWIQSMLFGLKATDPGAIGGAILLLIVTALLAAYLPARRASHVDPLDALRHE